MLLRLRPIEILADLEFEESILIFLTFIDELLFSCCSRLELGRELDHPFLLIETLCEAYLSSWGGRCRSADLLFVSSLLFG